MCQLRTTELSRVWQLPELDKALRPYWDCLSEKRCLDVRRVADHDCWSDSGLVSVIEVSFPVVVYQATSNRVACSNFFFGSRP